MSFVVLSIIRDGFFLNRVVIEATETVIVERVKLRVNFMQMVAIDQHNDLVFKEGGRAAIYVSKKFEVGSMITVQQVSRAVSAHRWQWLASRE